MVQLILVRSPWNRNSLPALAGALETHPELRSCVDVVDVKAAELSRIDCRGRAVAAFSFCSMAREVARRWLAALRERLGERLLAAVAGGPDPSGDPEAVLAMGFDAAVAGEGEEAFPALLAAILEGRDPVSVEGVLTSRDEVRPSRMAPPVDLEQFPPFPAGTTEALPLEIVRGCRFGCKFCQTSRLFGKRERMRSPEVLRYWAGELAKKRHPHVRVVAPNALAYGGGDPGAPNLDALAELLGGLDALLRPLGGGVYLGSFPSEVRPDFVTPEVLALMRRYAMNRRLCIGVQSGSERVLRRCGRQHGVEEGRRAVALALEAGFEPTVDFLFGLPGEREEDMRKSLDLAVAFMKRGARINAHVFMSLPGSAFEGRRAEPLPRWLTARLSRLAKSKRLYGRWSAHLAFEKCGPAPPH